MAERTCGALLVGISKYGEDGYLDLPFCENDAKAMRIAATRDLGIPSDCITDLIGNVDRETFNNVVTRFCESNLDCKILYFSGHGEIGGTHFLRFSDNKAMRTVKVIRKLKATCTSLIVFLDCCFSGQVTEELPNDDREASLVECGAGTLIISSSTKREKSYPTSMGNISVFTRCLCTAICLQRAQSGPFLLLADTINTCQRLMDSFNEHAPDSNKQRMTVKEDSSGPIRIAAPFYEHPRYGKTSTCMFQSEGTTYNVEPIHTATYRRYRASIVLSTASDSTVVPLAIKLVSQIQSHECAALTINRATNDHRPLQRIVGYIYPSDDMLLHNNHRYLFDWHESSTNVIELVRDGDLIFSDENLRIGKNPNFDFIKEHIENNRQPESEVWMQVAGYLDTIDLLWRQSMNVVNELFSDQIDRNALYERLKPLFEEMSGVINATLDTGYANSEKIESLVNSAIGLAGVLGDLKLFCIPEHNGSRSDINLRECLIDLRSRYAREYEHTWALLKETDPINA